MTHALRGPILNPQRDGSVDYLPDGLICWDAAGRITYVGPDDGRPSEPSRGLILPPLLDCHIHIPQWPIRGHFCDGVGHCEGGRLLEGLNRNVFPVEARCAGAAHTADVVERFRVDTLHQGVVGGAAYMTVHADATHAALAALGPFWHVGMVLMNQNCPPYLRTDEANLDRDVDRLAGDFGRRFIVTDRFAVAVNSPLRKRAVALAERHGLRMQTHLNEQPAEKALVERTLYPEAESYTDVYRRDGLLGRSPILAHCIHMRPAEWDAVAAGGCVVAHCPTSNGLLGSGIMPLDEVLERGIPYAICTDVGASPTTSLLAEMAVFLWTHAGRSRRATPSEALYRTTLGAAEALGLDDQLGTFAIGRPASFIEADSNSAPARTADDVIAHRLLWMSGSAPATEAARAALAVGGVEDAGTLAAIEEGVRRATMQLSRSVRRVTIGGQHLWTDPPTFAELF
jgi:guanine deaminase